MLAQAGRDPVMIALDDAGGKGRSLEFGGETWPWARTEKDAHARFWRQVILWLARRENKGEDQIKLKLDARRVAVGQKLDLTASARDGKNDPILDAQFEATFTPIDAEAKATAKAEAGPRVPAGRRGQGADLRQRRAGRVRGCRQGEARRQGVRRGDGPVHGLPGRPRAGEPRRRPGLAPPDRRDDGGQSLPSEELAKHLKALGPEAAEYVQQIDKRLWDNWPFFLIFTAVLTAEWALRKSKGWV